MMPTGPAAMPGMPQVSPQGGLGGPPAQPGATNPQGAPGGGGGGMDLNALMSMLGGGAGADPNAAATGGAPAAPGGGGGMGDIMSLLGGQQGAGAQPGAAPAAAGQQAGAGQYTWGPNGSVIANNTGSSGLAGTISNAKPLLMALLAALGVAGAIMLFRNKGADTEEGGVNEQAQQKFKTTLASAAEVETALSGDELDKDAKGSKVAEFREGLKEHLSALKTENAPLLEQPQRADLKEAFEALEASLSGLTNDTSAEKFKEAVTGLTEQFAVLEQALAKEDEASAPQTAPETGEAQTDEAKTEEAKTDEAGK